MAAPKRNALADCMDHIETLEDDRFPAIWCSLLLRPFFCHMPCVLSALRGLAMSSAVGEVSCQ